MYTRLKKDFVIAFCLYHMFSIGVYAIPTSTKNQEIKDLRRDWLRYTRPYVLSLSQWQQWNLFAPNPLRRVVHFVIEKRTSKGWVEVHEATPDTFAWYARPTELKIKRRVEKKDKESLSMRYLALHCDSLNLAGEKIKLRKRWHVIPLFSKNPTYEEWKAWKPEWHNKDIVTLHCPS